MNKNTSLFFTKKTIGILVFLLSFHLYAPPIQADFSFTQPIKNSQFVTFVPQGQLGNLLFETAVTCAIAWSNNAEPYLPDSIPEILKKHVFFRCSFKIPPGSYVSAVWREPAIAFFNIPYAPNLKLLGYFQSEKYFKNYRKQIIQLFTPNQDDEAYIERKYHAIINHSNSVGVQVRYYKWEDPNTSNYPQYGKDYLAKAMSQFPSDSLFVISSNNIPFVKKALPAFAKNIVILENEPNYIDLFVLSRCKHNIITNSSFGWWAAWLNQNPTKRVLYPEKLFYYPYKDYCPDEWEPVAAYPEK